MRGIALLVLTYVGFISLGLPDGMLGVAWPFMRQQFGLPLDAISAILVCFTFGYLVSSFGSGTVLRWMRLGTLLSASAAASALSLLVYSMAPAWSWIVAMAAIGGIGAGAVDSCLNSYAAQHHSPRTVTWLHASFGLGAATGPAVLGGVISQGRTWQFGYACVGVALLVLGAAFLVTRTWWPDGRSGEVPKEGTSSKTSLAPLSQSLRLPTIWLGMLTFLVYTGLESAVGTWTFTLLTSHYELSAVQGGAWASAYWASIAIGRLLAGGIVNRMGHQTMLSLSAGLVLAGAVIANLGLGVAGTAAGIAAIGLGCAPIFPLLISATPGRVDRGHIANAVGFQIASATLGQAALPSLVGVLARHLGLSAIAPAWLVMAVILLILVRQMNPRRPAG